MLTIVDETTPIVDTRKVIKRDGVEIGEIRHEQDVFKRDRWHAIVTVRIKEGVTGDYYLMQGFGETPTAALQDGISKATSYRDGLILALQRFKADATHIHEVTEEPVTV
jgi:hypothetical protein